MNESKRSEIAKRAYQIWLAEGCPEGKEREHWLRAEQEVAGQSSAPQSEGRSSERQSADPAPPVDTRPAPPIKAAPPLDGGEKGTASGEPASAEPSDARPKRKSTRASRSRTPPQQG